MWTVNDILAYIVHDCVFIYFRIYDFDCFNDMCNLSFHISYDMIIDGKY